MSRGLGLLALALLVAVPAARAAEDAPTVIVLSWDGTRHDAPDRVASPALARLQREGARAERLVPVFPPNTFPAHVSLATGTHPDRHGVLDNRFFDRERGHFSRSDDASWIQAEPLWIAAERQGVTTAVFYWVGSASDWRGARPRYRVAPFDSGIDEAAKVDQILRWLDLPDSQRPRLVMAWWHGADSAGHANGPDHPAVASALDAQGIQLGRLLDGIDARRGWPHTTLLLVSDHGMTRVRGEVPLRQRLQAAGIDARVVGSSAVSHVFLDSLAQHEAVEAELARLSHVRWYRFEALPAALRLRHPTRTGDLVVLAEPGWIFRGGTWRERFERRLQSWLGRETGAHGYPPEHSDMAGVFLAMGRGVTPGARLGAASQIDVAPTVAHLLGIEPPRDAEGAPIPGIGPETPAGPGPERVERAGERAQSATGSSR